MKHLKYRFNLTLNLFSSENAEIESGCDCDKRFWKPSLRKRKPLKFKTAVLECTKASICVNSRFLDHLKKLCRSRLISMCVKNRSCIIFYSIIYAGVNLFNLDLRKLATKWKFCKKEFTLIEFTHIETLVYYKITF